MKQYAGLLLLMMVVVLSACNNKETTADKSGKVKTEQEEKEERVVDGLEKINLKVSVETLKNMPVGTLMDHLSFEEDSKEVSYKAPDLDPELVKALPDKLEELTKSTDDLEKVKKGLIKLLASPNYNEVIEKAESYEPPFEEPYLPDPTKSEDGEKGKAPEKAIILLDASSSMLLQSNGNLKMDIAKDAVKSFAQTIGQSSEVSLVVYGHKGSEADSDKEESCTGIEEIYPMGEYSKGDFQKAVSSFESKGWTPLAGAIQKATEMSSGYERGTTIYIVSDGAETCDGDPVQASKELAEQNKNNAVSIIGFDVDAEAENQLKEVAEAGNGEYYKADSPEELENTIQYEWLPSAIDLAWAHTMAPNGWDVSSEYDNAEEYPRKLWYIGRRETHRISDAIDIMVEKEVITSKQASELESWAADRGSEIKDIYNKLYDENRKKTNDQVDSIKKKIDDWVEKMRKLKEERGDTW